MDRKEHNKRIKYLVNKAKVERKAKKERDVIEAWASKNIKEIEDKNNIKIMKRNKAIEARELREENQFNNICHECCDVINQLNNEFYELQKEKDELQEKYNKLKNIHDNPIDIKSSKRTLYIPGASEGGHSFIDPRTLARCIISSQ